MISPSVDDDLFETVAADFLARFRGGGHPQVEDYTRQHPEIADEIRELFPTMLAIERMKLQKEHSSGGQASLGARKLERLGDFRIIREIGRGGMGVVFEAEQESLKRHVALKVLPPNALQDDSHVRRFHREAQTAARLHHTNIVPVFGVGEHDGLHYYVMQLIDGEPLDRRQQSRTREPFDPLRAADIMRQIAEAVQYAHDHGTLHRDIKPANLLLDRTGNVWITDFGLAQVLERDETVTDNVAGTLRYMAPERFRGVADARSDQYSLGISLYELVTGARAFEGSSSGELLHRISLTEPTPVRALSPQTPRDLQTIIEKAISKDPAHRYGSVREFAKDLERFLDGQPIQARPVSAPERFWRWCLRNRALASSLASVAALLLVVAGMMVVGYFRTRTLNAVLTASLNKEQQALENERRARDQEIEARQAAEAITTLALEGLDRVFDEFAPAAPHAIAVPLGHDSSQSEDALLLPAQVTVTPQVANALERLLPLYRQLAEETAQDAQVRLRAASAQYRLGLIYRQLGRLDGARTALTNASNQLRALQQENILSATEWRLLLAQTLNDLGDLDRQDMQRFVERRSMFNQALEMLSEPAVDSLNRDERLELARTHFYLGRRDGFGPAAGFAGPGRNDRGREGPRGGGPNDRGPGDRGPGDRGPGRDAPRGRPEAGPTGRSGGFASRDERPENRGPAPAAEIGRGGAPSPPPRPLPADSRAGGGDRERPPADGVRMPTRDENRLHLTTAIALLEDFPQGDRDTRVKLLLARVYREQSGQRSRDEREQARDDRQKATDLLRELVKEAPETPDFRFELCDVLADVEPRWTPDDRLMELEPRLREALALASALVVEAPDVPAYVGGQTQVLVKLASLLRRTQREEEARQRLHEAISLQSMLSHKFPDSLVHVVWGARIKRSLVELMLAEHQFEQTIELLKSTGQELEARIEAEDYRRDPTTYFAWFTLGEIYGVLADVLQDQGRPLEAEIYRQKLRDFVPAGVSRRAGGPEERRPPPVPSLPVPGNSAR